MRFNLTYAFILLPALLLGQRMQCQFDFPLNTTSDSNMYQLYSEVIHHAQHSLAIRNRSVVYIPVVIHVVAREPFQAISVAQATQQLDVVNADFAGRGENRSRLSDEFDHLVGDAQIQFCLAALDPDGLPTSGITFTSTDIPDIALQTGEGGRKVIQWDQLGGKTGWDPTRYLNIWVGEYGGFLGSATFPGMAPYPQEIGVIMDPRFFGAIGDAGQSGFYSRGHTLTHEIGHFFGLKHIWGEDTDSNCDDDDGIVDTPNAAGPYYNCPSGAQSSCGSNDMYQNFMDFTDDRCLAAFTKGQSMVMQSVREIYYPDLDLTAGCITYDDDFQEWYAHLIWSHDAGSNRFVIYNSEIWAGTKHIIVYSVDGKIIREDTWEGEWSYLLDLVTVSSGVYIVNITDGGKGYSRKLVVY